MNKALLELAEIHYGKSPKGIRVDSSEYPIFGTGGQVGYAVKPLFKAPGIVVGRKGTLGNPIFSPDDFWAIDTTYAVLPKSAVEAKWIYYNLLNYDLTKLNEATGVPSINRDYLYKITFCYFELEEQRKIAEVLTTVDDAIEQTEALIRKYQRIKQGLMQDLLLPRKAWPVMPLGIACKKGGGSIQTGPFGSQLHSGDYKDEGVPIITVEHLGDNEIIHSNLPLVGEEDYLRLSKYKLITGDLVFSRVGAIDRCAYVSENENGWLFSGRCLRVRPGKLFDQKFLSYLLNHYSSRQWILNNSVGSTMRCLNTTILSELPIILPSLDEQKDIGDKLTSIDDQIQIIRREYEKLKKIKQGLMQDLLTGKVRVNALLEQ